MGWLRISQARQAPEPVGKMKKSIGSNCLPKKSKKRKGLEETSALLTKKPKSRNIFFFFKSQKQTNEKEKQVVARRKESITTASTSDEATIETADLTNSTAGSSSSSKVYYMPMGRRNVLSGTYFGENDGNIVMDHFPAREVSDLTNSSLRRPSTSSYFSSSRTIEEERVLEEVSEFATIDQVSSSHDSSTLCIPDSSQDAYVKIAESVSSLYSSQSQDAAETQQEEDVQISKSTSSGQFASFDEFFPNEPVSSEVAPLEPKEEASVKVIHETPHKDTSLHNLSTEEAHLPKSILYPPNENSESEEYIATPEDHYSKDFNQQTVLEEITAPTVPINEREVAPSSRAVESSTGTKGIPDKSQQQTFENKILAQNTPATPLDETKAVPSIVSPSNNAVLSSANEAKGIPEGSHQLTFEANRVTPEKPQSFVSTNCLISQNSSSISTSSHSEMDNTPTKVLEEPQGQSREEEIRSPTTTSHMKAYNESALISTCSSSIMSEPISSSDESSNVGHRIRSQVLDGSVFGSEADSMSEDQFEHDSHYRSLKYKKDDESENSFVVVGIPFDRQDEDMGEGSDIATVSSEEALMQLEEIYSDLVNAEDVEIVSNSHLGLPRDDASAQSSIMSYDSKEFDEEDQDGYEICCKSKMASIDMATIKEEAEEEEEEGKKIFVAEGTCLPFPLNSELHLRRQALVSQQGSEMSSSFSSVTDDSYVNCMSFDSMSISTRGTMKSRTIKRERSWGLSSGSSERSLQQRSLRSLFNEDASQFTFESSNVSFGASVCSYDSFSSESVKNMVETLKNEAERRRSKIKERIALIRAQTDGMDFRLRSKFTP